MTMTMTHSNEVSNSVSEPCPTDLSGEEGGGGKGS